MIKKYMVSTAAVCLIAIILNTGALAKNGVCSLTPTQATGSYGLAGHGLATTSSFFTNVPGDFTQVGTITMVSQPAVGIFSTGTFSVDLSQVDPSGVSYNGVFTFEGSYQINLPYCQATLVAVTVRGTPLPTPVAVFSVIFVSGGSELRMISVLPGVYIDYPSTKKLQ